MNNRFLVAEEDNINRKPHPHRVNALAGIYPKAFSNCKRSPSHYAQEATEKVIGNQKRIRQRFIPRNVDGLLHEGLSQRYQKTKG